ncbi:acyl-CoA synthetase (AMP-forming)/AMP-acid ligase II [Actinoallomurus bryophytorum]|uniref:Acyl-CoA synthetase (AMP-forming)/AMP-acid ligase II n=1 Tax=Actinoallomurus bryophytorum TaxID=1490222 RepID=A0A543CJF2_9ACTN|nr:class I adenylate-forming enzyme family protein [Actinoallomurus bryophytorum]TQL97228.1 acyl-CoA synthetase (AMP-forming)/AMP-acid ligase II [Actinoallomurus bryophytorum]
MAVFAARARTLHPSEKVARYRDLGYWTDETIDQIFRDQVARRPDDLALVDSRGKTALCGLAPHRLSWAALDALVERLAASLLRTGIRAGDVVGVQLPNIAELVATYLAVIRIGGVVSPLPVQYREHELEMLARLAGFDAFVTTSRIRDRQNALVVAEVLPDLPVFAFGAGAPVGVVHLDGAPATPADRALVAEWPRRTDPNECVTICWTSGTESAPKAVPRCHYDWLAISQAPQDGPELTADDVILNPFPLVNVESIAGTMLPWLRVGATYVLHHPFTLPTLVRQIAEEQVTYTVAPPPVLALLLHNEELLRDVDLRSLRAIASGSAPLVPSMVRGWQERLGIAVINMFGSNEGVCLMSAPADFPDPEVRARFFPRYGHDGATWSTRVGNQLSLRLVDLETEEEITEPGRPGELRVDGPTVFAGYLPGTTDDVPFDDQGYLRTGDVFEIAGDRRQYLRYVDRRKDLISRDGMTVAPLEVECLLARHPGVAESAVVGYPDPVLGEKACAVVVVRPGVEVDAEELLDHLRRFRIAPYKLPERFVFVDRLPRNPVGKVTKRSLSERLRTDGLAAEFA